MVADRHLPGAADRAGPAGRRVHDACLSRLQEGRAEQAAGRDVVIGYLEPHDRPDTTAQAEGLEQLPRRTVTFPDTVLASADEIVLVDLTPQALTQRLREGKVYPPDRVPSALNGFFRVENLAALREVALRQVAEDVENKRLVPPIEALGTREEQIFGDAPPPVAERILVLVEPDERSRRLVRRAWRSSQRLAAELDLLYVASPGNPPRGEQRERLEELRRLASILDASILDATFIVEEGDDVADTAARIATDRGTTYLIIGQSHPREATDRHLDSRCARCGPEPVRVA